MNVDELVWFDKNGTRSKTSTVWDSKDLTEMYSYGSSILLFQHDDKLVETLATRRLKIYTFN